MQQRLYRRLTHLEGEASHLRSLRAATDRQGAGEGTIRSIKLFLRIRGIEQTGTESLFDAFARALGIGNRELRALSLGGVDPIKKWFADNGIFEEIELRKGCRDVAGRGDVRP